jgi:hypothetical protein
MDYFMAIIKAGLMVALPMLVISILNDSFFYGRLCFPQYNFVYINVVENISAQFGAQEWFFLLIRLPGELTKLPYRDQFCNFTFMMFATYQMHNSLPA